MRFGELSKWIGNMSEVPAPVYVHVRQRSLPSNSFSFNSRRYGIYGKDQKELAARQYLKFDEEIVNIGGAMNLQRGEFTAPKDGTYFFTFTGSHHVETEYAIGTPFVHLKRTFRESVNGVVSRSHESVRLIRPFVDSFSIQTIAHLKKGDNIELRLSVFIREEFEHYFSRFFPFSLRSIRSGKFTYEFVAVLLNEKVK